MISSYILSMGRSRRHFIAWHRVTGHLSLVLAFTLLTCSAKKETIPRFQEEMVISNTQTQSVVASVEIAPEPIMEETEELLVEQDEADGGTESGLAKVCLSPGHPSEPGDKLYEGIINRKVAFLLKDLLCDAGYDVLIVTDDLERDELFHPYFDNEGEYEQALLEVMSPTEKVEVCNEWEADYLISLHHNYAYDKTENHTLVLFANDENYEELYENASDWARITSRSLKKAMRVTDSRYDGDLEKLGFSLSILANADMIGILTEASFFSNPRERERLNRDGYLKREAMAIYRAFLKFYKRYHEE